jgi:hypothetical protein
VAEGDGKEEATGDAPATPTARHRATCGLSANIHSIHKAATRRGRSRKSHQNPIGTPSGFRSHATVCARTDDPYLILL